MMPRMGGAHYVFAGGGTGGHLFPGLAVAAALRGVEPQAAITFFTTMRPLDREVLESAGTGAGRYGTAGTEPGRYTGSAGTGAGRYRTAGTEPGRYGSAGAGAGRYGTAGTEPGRYRGSGGGGGDVGQPDVGRDITPYGQVEQPVRPVTLKPWRWPRFWWSWRQSVAAARAFLKDRQVRAVLGLGGYAAGPPVVAARSLGIRAAILNPDAIPGRANRYLAHRADLVVLQWDVSRRYFRPTVNCQTLGCPIRAEFATADAAAGRRRFEFADDRPVLLVTGASQGAHSVNQTMQHVWPEFVRKHADWQLLHLTGQADEAETRAAYTAARVCAKVLAFTHEMPLALAAADVVVSRAGASTLAEITALGKPAILLPYPYHRDRHQHVNARVLVEAGAAVLVEDERSGGANRGPLLAALESLTDAKTRQRVARAARGLGRRNAAEQIAAWLRHS